MKKSLSCAFVAAVAAAAAAMIAGCGRPAPAQPNPGPGGGPGRGPDFGPGPSRQPSVFRVERRDVIECCTEEGTLAANRSYSFQPALGPSSGDIRLLEMPVKEGDTVKKGDIVYQFETNYVALQNQSLQLSIEAMQARIRILAERRESIEKPEVRQRLLEAQARLAEDKRNLAIQQQLLDAGLGAAAEADVLRIKTQADELGVAAAQAQVEQMERHPRPPELVEAEARLPELRSQLQRNEATLSEFVGRAPFDGVVVALHDTFRNLNMSPKDMDLRAWALVGSLLTLADLDSMRVQVQFYEAQGARVRVGQEAAVTAKHVPGKTFAGKVTRIGKVGRTKGQSSVINVEVTVANPEHLLRPGLMAEVRILVAERKGVLAVPVHFVRHVASGSVVFRAEGAAPPREVPVTTGASDEHFVEIVSGLRENDTVAMPD